MSASLAGGAAADIAPRPATLRFTPSFYLWHLLPLAFLLFALVVAMNGIDQWLADAVFRWEGMQWALRDNPLTRHVIHQLGKRFSTLLWLGFAIALALTWRKPDWRPLRRPLAYVLLAVLISTITVTVIKSLTHMDCPWDLVRYGGGKPFIGLFQARPAGMGKRPRPASRQDMPAAAMRGCRCISSCAASSLAGAGPDLRSGSGSGCCSAFPNNCVARISFRTTSPR